MNYSDDDKKGNSDTEEVISEKPDTGEVENLPPKSQTMKKGGKAQKWDQNEDKIENELDEEISEDPLSDDLNEDEDLY